MNEYETEEQQIEALKKWWKENGASIIVGLLIGVTGLFGWRYYLEHKQAHAMQASDLYMQVMQTAMTNAVNDTTVDIHNRLVNQYSDTPYAALASLAMARAEYVAGNTDAAAAQLELAKKHAGDETVRQLANMRLAGLFIEQEKYDEALSLLNMSHDAIYDAEYEELRGDLYHARGDNAQARSAYDKAISLRGGSASKWLKLKRQSLGDEVTEKAATDDKVSTSGKGISHAVA